MKNKPFKINHLLILLIILLGLGFTVPQHGVIPVANATSKDWHKHSYWHYPWGASGVHKGIDIFSRQGAPVLSSTQGLVIFKGYLSRGGNVIAVLGPKWRIHYYAHLSQTNASWFDWCSKGEKIGEVGTTGNARGKPAHLHYSVITLIPNVGNVTTEKQGWKRMFYINPATVFIDRVN
ncbi:MAG: M23 family metallopeptidase [Methylophilus sp.]|nr:M23 family metallopeptidase [Methylophilus sp.]